MNKKSLWAAGTIVAALLGLQSANLFTAEVSTPVGIGLFLFSGICLYQMVSMADKQNEATHENRLIRETEFIKEIQHLASRQRDDFSDFVIQSEARQQEMKNFSKTVLESLEEGNSNMQDSIKDFSNQTEKLNQSNLVELKKSVLEFSKRVSSINDTIEVGNDSTKQALLDFSTQSEKLNQSNLIELKKSIIEFAVQISSVNKAISSMSEGQQELLESFTGSLGELLDYKLENIVKSITDAMEDMTEAQEEASTQISSLAMEYKVFEKLSESIIEKITTISQDDYNLMKEIFDEEVS